MLRVKPKYEDALKMQVRVKAPDRSATNKLKENRSKRKVNTKNMQNMINELPEQVNKISADIKLRHDFVESQKRANYVNEYERLSGELRSKTTPALQHARITNRLDDLVTIKLLFNIIYKIHYGDCCESPKEHEPSRIKG